jgi:hypothetical protein
LFTLYSANSIALQIVFNKITRGSTAKMGDLSDFKRGQMVGGVQLEHQKTNSHFIRSIQSSIGKGYDKGKGKVIPLQARCGPEGG